MQVLITINRDTGKLYVDTKDINQIEAIGALEMAKDLLIHGKSTEQEVLEEVS
ncbi:hypothetical protein [Dehalobacter sp. MCB1]|uniref:hypothetical protein n=1 Tax=Dehalobacter sp. MCB1 TaxID=1844756 RepID=UPI001314EFAB|nr:hypothetical protein [Dehalobacter sp. MCB1]